MNCLVKLPAEAAYIVHEVPTGLMNGVNLAYTTAEVFEPSTLKVLIDGHRLDPLDYIIGADNKSFTLIIQPANPNRLNQPPQDTEEVRVDYITAVNGACGLSNI